MKSAKFYCISALTALLFMGAGGAVMASNGGNDDGSRISRINSTQGEEVTIADKDVDIDTETGLITNFTNVEKARKLLAGGHLMIPAKINGTIVKGIGYNGEPDGVFDYDRLNYLVNSTQTDHSRRNKAEKRNKDAASQGISAITFAEPENILTIGRWAFYHNQISNIDLPEVTTIGVQAFHHNQITSVNLPQVISIKSESFFGNYLTALNLPKVQTIEDNAFAFNNLAKITLGGSNSTHNIMINSKAFSLQNLIEKSSGPLTTPAETAFRTNVRRQDPLKWQTITQAIQPSLKANGVEQLKPTNAILFSLNAGEHFNQTVKNDEENQQFTNIPQAGDHLNKFAIGVQFNPKSSISGNSQSTQTGNYSTAAVVNITNPTTPPTTTPDPQPEREKQPETNNNNSGNTININPAPDLDFPHQSESVDKVAKHPHTIYNKQTIRVHKNTELTSPLKTYRKVARHKAKTFKVLGVAYANNGAKRYKVAGGYVTAHKDYVANAHYQSVPKSKRVKVISTKGIHKYQDVKLTKRPTKSHVKRNKVLKVIKLVNQGNLTRYQLNDGSYISTNKTLIMQSK